MATSTAFCRAAYVEVLPEWNCVFVPWEQIIAERSHSWLPRTDFRLPVTECASCPSSYGAWKQLTAKKEEDTDALHQIGADLARADSQNETLQSQISRN